MKIPDGYTLLCGSPDFATVPAPAAFTPFSAPVLAFLADLSAALLKDKGLRPYPDIVTFAYFCRRASLEQQRAAYGPRLGGRIGRGMVFHIAPSNVPINFAYSLVSGLLAGNACVVKASSQDFDQTRLVCAHMAQLLAEEAHSALLPYVTVLTYPRERQDMTQALSARCNARIIWGGDETVARVRQAPLPSQAFDIPFADRYSMLVIRPGAVLALEEKQLEAMALGFYNDTYLTDQNACTSPRLIYWLEDGPRAQTLDAQKRFWTAVHAYAAPRYPVQPVVAVDKLTALYRAAILLPGVQRVPMPDNLVARIQVDALFPQVEQIRCPGGCFVEYASPTLEALASVVVEKYQTLSYWGVDPEALQHFVLEKGVKGIDRIVPLGKTMDFSLTWDGYDLILALSRQVQTIS